MTVASIFMMRLLSSTTDELYFPKNDHTTASLWNGFYCWMQQSFEDLNYDLANVSGNLLDFVHERQIPWRIALLMNIDVSDGLPLSSSYQSVPFIDTIFVLLGHVGTYDLASSS